MQELTKQQRAVLDVITNYINRNGISPTVSEISEAMGFKSPNSATLHLKALKKKGAIAIRDRTSRSITVIDRENSPLSIPSVNDSNYWFDGVFQHRRYERDVYRSLELAGVIVGVKASRVENKT
ncbi:LexA family transcriptional regulator [Hafnia alvei]|uniref:LexA family protein n=1 Tax=Hafnia alvei TaxID=569 RepID=UPI001033216B|nr:LexA family transcriptional regulator [Hafnia alvei]KAA0264817.1 LexA family transcriptional regulator [Hafnia alvei]TBL49050.1 LexA family transcriptional regulator [Obesumbacterium proteus]